MALCMGLNMGAKVDVVCWIVVGGLMMGYGRLMSFT